MGRGEQYIAFFGLVVSIGGGLASAFAPIYFPAYSAAGFWGGLAFVIFGLAAVALVIRHNNLERVMANKTGVPLIGTDIESSGGGVGLDINSIGSAQSPSLGGESIVVAGPGQSAIGTRVVQNGPGIGMRITQTGPGTGFRSVVTIGKPDETKP